MLVTIALSVLAISNIVLVVALLWVLTKQPSPSLPSSTTKPPTVKVKKSDELKPGLMRFEEDNVIHYLDNRERQSRLGRRDPHADWTLYGGKKRDS